MDAENNILGNYTTNKRPGDITTYSRRIDITYRHPNPGIVMGTGFTLTYTAIGYTYQGNLWWRHQMKTFIPLYWPFVRGIHRWPLDSPQKGQWRGAFIFSLMYAWTNGLANTRDADGLRRYRARWDVTLKPCFYTYTFDFVYLLILVWVLQTHTHTHGWKHIGICNNWRVKLDYVWCSFGNKWFWIHELVYKKLAHLLHKLSRCFDRHDTVWDVLFQNTLWLPPLISTIISQT